MNRLHLSTLLVCTVAVLGACSMFDPKNTNPYCGESINFNQVELVDMTAFDLQEDKITAALQAKLGNYRLVTEKPVQVPRDYAYWNSRNIKGIAGAKSEAAQWGCNLLVLMEVKAARTSGGVQARNEDRAWMVHVGTVSQ
ncbi:MAG: hypothetical protein SH820_00830 [Xanthomonadales bacterium]|nr:hypothetical protein [Xanthomonadales bacterium]